MRSSDDLSKLINQSGFPLQLAIERLVDEQSSVTGWYVLYREHGWKHPDGQTGFLDLAISNRHQTAVAVLECKRVYESDWVFLTPEAGRSADLSARLWVTSPGKFARQHFGYFDALLKPESYESNYCVVAGQDPKARPLLERLAAETIAATEALAAEEHPVVEQRGGGLRMYVPIIVTTARLHFSRIDTARIDIASGEATSIQHEEVPWMRFRKQLSPDVAVPPARNVWDFAELSTAKEKMVYVVQASHLVSFLRRWLVIDHSLHSLARP